MLNKILGIHAFLHSETGKKFLSIIYPRIKRYIPARAWLEWAYWKLDDPQTGLVDEVETLDMGEDIQVDRGEKVRYQDRERYLTDNNYILGCRKQPKDTCGIETVNNIIREQLVKMGAKPKNIPDEIIPIKATYDTYKHPSGGTNTYAAYPQIVSDKVSVKLDDNLDPELQLLFKINFFKRVVTNFGGAPINSATQERLINQMFNWIDKAQSTGKYLVAMSKHNSVGIPTYGITIPKHNGKSLDRTGGHITAVNTIFGSTYLNDFKCARMYESSHPRGQHDYKVYDFPTLMKCFNRCAVFEVNPDFVGKNFSVMGDVEQKENLDALIQQLQNELQRVIALQKK